jgi:hypothetical protein
VLDRQTHQLVPGWVEFHFIDALAESVVRVKDGRMLVSLKSPTDGLVGAHQTAEFLDLRPGPSRSLTL